MSDALESIAKKFGLKLIVLFGSAATGRIGPMSDVDVLVATATGISSEDESQLRSELSSAININEDKLDLVFVNRASGLLCVEALQKGKILYGDSIYVTLEQVRALRKLRDELRFAARHRQSFKSALGAVR